MKKAELSVIILSLLILIIPSTIVGVIWFLATGSFILPCIVSFVLLWIFGQLSNVFFQQKASVEIERIKLQLVNINNQQSVEVSCAYCKHRNVMPIKLNERNILSCSQCNQSSLVIFQFTTAQITTPLELPQLGAITEQ